MPKNNILDNKKKMRSFSLFTIFMLCLAILIVDVLAFYWLLAITKPIEPQIIKTVIYVVFWTFTIGLVASILILKTRLDKFHRKHKQLLISSLYGLTVSSFVPKIIFVVVISILYYTNYVFGQKESVYIVPIVGLLSGFLPFFVILFGIFKSLYRFKLAIIPLKHELLPTNFDGFKIAQISDLHLGSFNFRYHILDRAIETINLLKPDIIVFTGDLVNNFSWELKGWTTVLEKLNAKEGKYAVLGNHDYGDYSEWKTLELKKQNFENIKFFHKKIGFNLLLNEAVIIEREQDKLALIGVENWGIPPFKQYGNLNNAIKKVKHIPFKILLSHDPTHWSQEVIKDTNIALTLSGHTHGMQAGIKTKKREWSPIKYKYKHWAGLYFIGNQYLYVNRGLGWMGFPGRLGMRPEITLFELHAK